MQGKPTLLDELCEGAKRMETLRLDFGDLPDDIIRITLRTAAECFTDAAARLATYAAALKAAKEKLALYRAAHSGAYVGGVEYTALMDMIDKALEDNT